MQQDESMTDISDVCAWMSARFNLADVDPAIAAAELQRLHMLQTRAPLTSCGHNACQPSTKWVPQVVDSCQCGQCCECYAEAEQQTMDQWHWMHSVDRVAFDEEYERYMRHRLELDSEAREAIYHATLTPLLQSPPQTGAMAAPASEEDCEMMM